MDVRHIPCSEHIIELTHPERAQPPAQHDVSEHGVNTGRKPPQIGQHARTKHMAAAAVAHVQLAAALDLIRRGMLSRRGLYNKILARLGKWYRATAQSKSHDSADILVPAA